MDVFLECNVNKYKNIGNISIRYKPDLLMGEVRGKVINYTSISHF